MFLYHCKQIKTKQSYTVYYLHTTIHQLMLLYWSNNIYFIIPPSLRMHCYEAKNEKGTRL